MPWVDQKTAERLGAAWIADKYADARKDVIAGIMVEVEALRDRMAALCNRENVDATDVAAFWEAANEWRWAMEQR